MRQRATATGVDRGSVGGGSDATDSYSALSGSSAAGGTRTTHGYPGMDEYEDGGHSPRAWRATTITVDRSAAGRE